MGEGHSCFCYTLYQDADHVGCLVVRVHTPMGEGDSCFCYTLYQGVDHVRCLVVRVNHNCPPLRILHLTLDLVEAMIPGQDGEGNVFGQHAVHPADLKQQRASIG